MAVPKCLLIAMTGVFAVAAVSLAASSGARAQSAFEQSWRLCADATQRVEYERRIPRHLLEAISLAESGRWDNVEKRTHAWPWTVTSGDEQWMLDTKAEAVAQVRKLQSAGRTNIDVGCMQINLRYHPDAFATLEDAFDPLTNARYAGEFLTDLYGTSRNWLTAAGNYHSNTENFHNRYKLKVARFWNARRGIGGAATASAGAIQSATGTPQTAAIDHERMAMLNEAFRKRQAEAEAKLQAQMGASTGAIGTRGVGNLTDRNYALQAQIQRVRKQAEKEQRVQDLIRSEKVPLAEPEVNPDLQLWRNLYRSGPTAGPFL